MNRYENLSRREQELLLDLDTTEFAFYKARTKKARKAINKIRYIVILELHKYRTDQL